MILWERLGFTVNEVVHHYDVIGRRLQEAIPTGDPNQKDALAAIEAHSEEREAAAIRGARQYILADQQYTIDIEVVDPRAGGSIDVGEDCAKPVDGRRAMSAGHKEEDFCDRAVQR